MASQAPEPHRGAPRALVAILTIIPVLAFVTAAVLAVLTMRIARGEVAFGEGKPYSMPVVTPGTFGIALRHDVPSGTTATCTVTDPAGAPLALRQGGSRDLYTFVTTTSGEHVISCSSAPAGASFVLVPGGSGLLSTLYTGCFIALGVGVVALLAACAVLILRLRQSPRPARQRYVTPSSAASSSSAPRSPAPAAWAPATAAPSGAFVPWETPASNPSSHGETLDSFPHRPPQTGSPQTRSPQYDSVPTQPVAPTDRPATPSSWPPPDSNQSQPYAQVQPQQYASGQPQPYAPTQSQSYVPGTSQPYALGRSQSNVPPQSQPYAPTPSQPYVPSQPPSSAPGWSQPYVPLQSNVPPQPQPYAPTPPQPHVPDQPRQYGW